MKDFIRLQSNLVSKLVSDAEAILNDENNKNETEAGKFLLRAQRGLPKHSKLAKVLSEPSYKKLVQVTELEFLREKAKNMYIIDDELYFVIDEKNNTLDLTEKGREELAKGTGMEKDYFILPDLGTEISKFENDPDLSPGRKNQRRKMYFIRNIQKAVIEFIP